MSFTVQEALSVVQATTPLKGAESVSTLAADQALADMWNAYAWFETLGELDPIVLIPGVQDYAEPLANLPGDLGGLWEVSYLYLPGDGTKKVRDLRIKRSINETQVEALPEDIAYQRDREALRLGNVPPENVGSPYHFIIGTYKKTPPRVTRDNESGLALPFEDELALAYITVLRGKFFALLNDPRARDAEAAAMFSLERVAAMRGMLQGSDQLISTINVNGF